MSRSVAEPPDDPVDRQRVSAGWSFVAVQAALLVALLILPNRDHWPTPLWIRITGLALVGFGIAFIVLAASRLGRALTPTPVPKAKGKLATDGLYAFVRHPIYTGLLAIVAGHALRSGSLLVLAVAVATASFLRVKAHWEEARLKERYPGYAQYAERTPRFIPRRRRGP